MARAGLTGDARMTIWHGNAADFPIPHDTSMLYFFNPFHGQVLVSVLENLYRVVRTQEHSCFVVVMNPVHFSAVAYVRHWLVPLKRYRFEFDTVVYRADPHLAGGG